MDKKDARIFAKTIMPELYQIQNLWNAWEEACMSRTSSPRKEIVATHINMLHSEQNPPNATDNVQP